MTYFTIYTPDSAPTPSNEILDGLKKAMSFVPNVFAVMGGTPHVLSSFVELNKQFSETSLSATEREIIQISVSVENACAYCVAGHTAFAKMQNISDEIIIAVRNGGNINDPRLAALHDFTRALVTTKGHLDSAEKDRFIAAGYSKTQMQEVILGVCVKTFSNFISVLLDIPLDEAFSAYAWVPQSEKTLSEFERQVA